MKSSVQTDNDSSDNTHSNLSVFVQLPLEPGKALYSVFQIGCSTNQHLKTGDVWNQWSSPLEPYTNDILNGEFSEFLCLVVSFTRFTCVNIETDTLTCKKANCLKPTEQIFPVWKLAIYLTEIDCYYYKSNETTAFLPH